MLSKEERQEKREAKLIEKEEKRNLKIYEKYMEQLEKIPAEERSRKVIQRAISRGFGYGDVRRAMERCREEDPEGTDA